MSTARLVCSQCLSDKGLWRDVNVVTSAWQPIRPTVDREGNVTENPKLPKDMNPYPEVDSVEGYGCSSCNRRDIPTLDLLVVQIGTDGKPLREQAKGQGDLGL